MILWIYAVEPSLPEFIAVGGATGLLAAIGLILNRALSTSKEITEDTKEYAAAAMGAAEAEKNYFKQEVEASRVELRLREVRVRQLERFIRSNGLVPPEES